MSTAHGFTYGSLMFDEVMRAVADQQGLVSIPATLKGWERFAIRNASYPAARPGKPQASIRGVLWL
ncbi:MAG: gamma-glutamylcyclotransferase, partial [Betaproteobacteria bacterium]|nr:gamma-glutamylcyclotransferase [Betaproteobacteria bacterium]